MVHEHDRDAGASRASTSPRRRSAPGVLAVLTPENAPKLPQRQRSRRSIRRRDACCRCCRTIVVHYNGQPIAVGRRRHARARAGARRRSCASTYDEAEAAARLRRAPTAPHQPAAASQRARSPSRPRAATSMRALRGRDVRVDARVHDAGRAPQSDGAARDDRAVGGRPRSRSTTRRRASSGVRRRVAKTFGIPPENVRVVSPLRRRRLRLQGLGVVARRCSRRWRRARSGRPVKLVLDAPADVRPGRRTARARSSTSRSARRATARSPRSGT